MGLGGARYQLHREYGYAGRRRGSEELDGGPGLHQPDERGAAPKACEVCHWRPLDHQDYIGPAENRGAIIPGSCTRSAKGGIGESGGTSRTGLDAHLVSSLG